MKKLTVFLAIIILLATSGTLTAQDEATPPAIISFTSELTSITLPDAETGQKTTRLSWTTLGMTDEHNLQLYAYEINNWNLISDDTVEPLQPNSSLVIPVRHPLNFNPPTYRLIIFNSEQVVLSESTLMIPYDTTSIIEEPALIAFTSPETSITANALTYDNPVIPVSWEIANRPPGSHIVFEQVLPDGSTVPADFPRANLWVSSKGQGAVKAIMPTGGNTVALRLRLVDVGTNATLQEGAAVISITGTVSTPTPRPANTQPPTNQPNTGNSSGDNPAPVVSAGSGGNFELGGHISGYGFTNEMRSAGMTWAKSQVRWARGDGTGAAAGAINEARANGFKILLGVVGYREDLADFEAYTNDFAAYLGQVAALSPDAIEVWNEPNIDREWLTGGVNGAAYTQLLAKAYNAIKTANPNVMVISAALAPTGFFGGGCANAGCDDNVFLRQMANAGAINYMDCVGAHYNEGIISPDQTSGDPRGGHYTRYFNAMLNTYYNAFGGARRVCWTELGFLTSEGYGPLPSFFSWASGTTLAQHAEWLGRAASLSRSSGKVRLMIVWNVDFRVYTDDPQGGYAIARPDGTCPACAMLGAAMQ